ncbi:MAG: GDP-mannose 4,6-dehydratase [Bacteriovoracaceae bacterium]|nr:GDP-mannose 4,6-dehydratase [Bacteriovoracaceae bacterium]
MTRVTFPEKYDDLVFLIAGAAGFVPGHVSEFFLNKGATVIGIDNFITGSRENIELLSKYDKFKFYEANIYEGLPDLTNQKVDFILNLASPASPIDFEIIPIEIMRTNSEGSLALLELAKVKGARFLEASTSEVYGDPEIHPQVETYFGNVNTLGPRAPYDESKRFAEAMTMSFHRKYGVDTRIVRIFNTYGPRMRANDGRVIPNFINQALRGEDITIYGDGSQTRSFCFVTDLVNAIHNVLFSHDVTPFNIGNPDEYSVKDCAEIIVKALNSTSKIVYMPLPQDDPKRRRPNIDKLQAVCDYTPEVSFVEGLRQTTEFFKKGL